jgi:hypothetical protein
VLIFRMCAHIGPQPERIGAVAFTIGTDIYFRGSSRPCMGGSSSAMNWHSDATARGGTGEQPDGLWRGAGAEPGVESGGGQVSDEGGNTSLPAQAKREPSVVQRPAPVSSPIATAPGRYPPERGDGGSVVQAAAHRCWPLR